MEGQQLFSFDFYPWTRALFSLAGHGPKDSSVQITPETITIHSGWLFQMDIPRSSITAVSRSSNPWWNVGGAQTNGLQAWAVGGAYKNIVKLELEPKAHGKVLSFLSISASKIFLSLEDPDGFIAVVKNT